MATSSAQIVSGAEQKAIPSGCMINSGNFVTTNKEAQGTSQTLNGRLLDIKE